jgi:hypothetical protein
MTCECSKTYQRHLTRLQGSIVDETKEKDRDDAAVTSLMRAAAKAKAASYRGKFSKYAAVANPKLGDKFLEEVNTAL